MMLRLWLQKSGSKATGNELEKGLRKVNREDIIKNCMFNVEIVTDDVEKAVAKVHLDQSGFDVFKEELGSSRDASIRRGASLDISYDEQDIMKEAESAAETSSETGSLFERDQISQALTDDKERVSQTDECNADDDVAALFPKCKMPSNHQNEETLINNLNAQEINAPFAISEGDDNILKIKMATNSIEPETQAYAKQHEFWPSVPVTTSNEALIVPSDSINSEQSTNNKEIGFTPNISKEESLNISNLIISEQEIKTPLIDKIADNYKSNDSSDFGYCSMDKVTCTSPTSIRDSENPTNTSKNNSEQSGPESPLAISPELNLERTPDERLSIEQTSEMRLIEGENTFQKQPASENVCLKNEMALLHTSSSVGAAAAESTEPLAIGNESNIICEHSVEAETTIQSEDNKYQDFSSKDARIRRASKTPPPSPVDRNGGDYHADKVKEILLTQSALENKFKEDYFKGPSEVEQKLAEISGRPEIPARLTESETWPSLELDTSQVSISSLPEDEKTEPTTATVSDAVALAADTDDNGESNDEKDPLQVIQPSTPMAVSSPDRQAEDEVEIKETVVKLHPEETGKVTEITTVTRTVRSEIDSRDSFEDSPLQKLLQDGATVTASQEVVTVVSSSEPVSAVDGKTVETSEIERISHDSKGGNGFVQTTSTTVTPESSEKIVRTVTTTCTTVSSADDHAHPGGSSDEHAPPS